MFKLHSPPARAILKIVILNCTRDIFFQNALDSVRFPIQNDHNESLYSRRTRTKKKTITLIEKENYSEWYCHEIEQLYSEEMTITLRELTKLVLMSAQYTWVSFRNRSWCYILRVSLWNFYARAETSRFSPGNQVSVARPIWGQSSVPKNTLKHRCYYRYGRSPIINWLFVYIETDSTSKRKQSWWRVVWVVLIYRARSTRNVWRKNELNWAKHKLWQWAL